LSVEILKLIYFKECPNAERAMSLVTNAGYKFTAVCQDDLAEHDSMMNYSSPTLLLNDKVIIFGAKASSGGSCSIELPSSIEIAKRIKTVDSQNDRRDDPI
jgi:hypothetical protein